MSYKDFTDIEKLVGQDEIDSRDLVEAVSDYESEIDEEMTTLDRPEWKDLVEDESLRELVSEINDAGQGIPDWPHGARLIREDHFETFARQYAEDSGSISDDVSWPCDHIDWEKAADHLKMDFTSITLGDYTYYVR